MESTKGDLLCVRRFFEGETSSKFMVCKLVLDDDNGFVVGEVEVQSIGDDALFLGDNSPSVSVLASNYPGCQPNCIYFTLRLSLAFPLFLTIGLWNNEVTVFEKTHLNYSRESS